MGKINEECGIFGIVSTRPVAKKIKLASFEQQHRGQESCGIATSDGAKIYCQTRMGLVMISLTDSVIAELPGTLGIGHVRYSTAGGSKINNAQPFKANTKYGQIAVAHNGTITNAEELKQELVQEGALFQSDSDTEVALHLIAKSKQPTMIEAIKEALQKLRGAYCLVFLTENSIIAARDPRGMRPLVIGKLPRNRGFVFASEECAFRHCKAKLIGKVSRGELVIAKQGGLEHQQFAQPTKSDHLCAFEKVYFARPGDEQYLARSRSGIQLAKEYAHLKADIVIGVPDSGIIAALGFSKQSGIPYDLGLTRNHYTGRSFIEPTQEKRGLAVELKLSPVNIVVRGKVVIVIDDSLVRGTTGKKIIGMLKNAGAKKVYFLLACPPILHPCYDGVDIPDRKELIAVDRSYAEIAKEIRAAEVGYLSIPGLLDACGESEEVQHCTGCMDGNRYELVQITT